MIDESVESASPRRKRKLKLNNLEPSKMNRLPSQYHLEEEESPLKFKIKRDEPVNNNTIVPAPIQSEENGHPEEESERFQSISAEGSQVQSGDNPEYKIKRKLSKN